MKFVLIPASGKGWKSHCESRDIEYQPISSFYIQRSELTRLQFAAAFPDDIRVSSGEDLHPSQPIPNWLDAVRSAHAMSANDLSFDYRLPTVAEWRYTYYFVLERPAARLADSVDDMVGGNWEFAVKSRMPTVEATRNGHDPSFNSESYVMAGSPPDHENSTFTEYASPTPATGDDGIDEYTGVRMVLVPVSTAAP